jgi:hypothetical protein
VLRRPSLGRRLSEIGASLTQAGHVRFDSPGDEFAVRAFVWRHFPALHDVVAAWVREAVDSKGLSDPERQDLVHGFTDQCLTERYRSFWTALVRQLTVEPVRPARMSAAVAILRHCLSTEKSGRMFRQQIYQWSRAGDASQVLAQALVEACETMSDTHPEEALVRLHHIARRHPRRVGARDALIELACADPWLLTLLLSRLTAANPDITWTADADIFLDVANTALLIFRWPDSRPLIAQGQVVNQLQAGWRLAFTKLSYAAWAPAAQEWLFHAAQDGANQQVLLDVLIDGAEKHADVLSGLFGLVHRAGFRAEFVSQVLSKINTALGVNEGVS